MDTSPLISFVSTNLMNGMPSLSCQFNSILPNAEVQQWLGWLLVCGISTPNKPPDVHWSIGCSPWMWESGDLQHGPLTIAARQPKKQMPAAYRPACEPEELTSSLWQLSYTKTSSLLIHLGPQSQPIHVSLRWCLRSRKTWASCNVLHLTTDVHRMRWRLYHNGWG